MRPYRGKRIDSMGWVYGWYCETFGDHYIMLVTPEKYRGETLSYKVDPSTVGQYTGLPDEHGKYVFEGDIAEGEHAVYLIAWDASQAQYKAKIFKTKSVLAKHCSFPLWQYVEDDGRCRFKVIGNRWDNPELLEVKE